MKYTVKINLVGAALVAAMCVIFALLIFAVVSDATAQTPAPQPDVDLSRSGATYPFACQPTEPLGEMVKMCAVRTDLDGDPIELGCADHFTLAKVVLTITVARTQGVDGEIRCYAIDDEGNATLYSDNFGRTDFTPPGKPWVTE